MLSVTETETLAAYMKPPSRYGGAGGAGGLDDSSGGPAKGFVVRDAPWNAAGNKVLKCLNIVFVWSGKSKCLFSLALHNMMMVLCVFQAPDMSSAEDFPTFGTGVTLKQASAWGPKKF